MIGEIITYWNKNKAKILKMDTEEKETLFKNLVFAAFGYNDEEGISLVYPKEKISMREINKHLTDLLDEKKMPLGRLLKKNPIHDRFGNIVEEDMDDEDDEIKKRWHPPLPNMICLSKNILFSSDVTILSGYFFFNIFNFFLFLSQMILTFDPKKPSIALTISGNCVFV